jgi:hypothetical protein
MLEAEAVAHAKAMKEAAQLDNRMRDTYSQLRRSAYDLGTSSTPADDAGGVRIKPPQTPTTPVYHSHTRSHSREVTLLENGMIVEHVDVRREEREARERRRKEEKRARKSSRSSVFDVTSIISAQSTGLTVDNTLKPRSAVSHTGPRPVSELTPNDRPEIPRAYSQASFSDVHSLGSGSSPRRPKFFGMRNLSTGWRSQDSLAHSFAPSGMSGSMVDMQYVNFTRLLFILLILLPAWLSNARTNAEPSLRPTLPLASAHSGLMETNQIRFLKRRQRKRRAV